MDRLVTVFGGGGFIGRYVCQALLKAGARVRIAQRDPKQAWFVKPLGGLGQTQFVACDIRDRDQVSRAVAGSDAVVNLVGVLKGNFKAFHVDGARNIAEAAAAAGARTLVHISAIGADPASPSAYGRSKGEGEHAVRKAFPDAIILRPSIVFGREDNFINRFARMARLLPVLPIVGGKTKFQPVYVADVARVVCESIANPDAHAGQTYELGGPQILSMHDLNALICKQTGRSNLLIDVPDIVASAMARVGSFLPGAPITWDQWLMLQRDNVVSGAEGLKAFGITPTPIAAVADGWLTSYRRHGRFAAKSPY
ncbi:complex I NDUFA9 subunit family protein [Allosphingosinicella flava]|uniref:Complex I NDUFA9 subunit family protein n=1 Tax=Allosphingosinicella flava TaxID=2771430 RepID=A0A7T2GJF9_9SPHN|nr:complex I NDUFA9 subunit family protein [Sphingosinicella flava]QPQ54951.1 complex I NDUFA9 subunit family protein [Sphingosinicella flava]